MYDKPPPRFSVDNSPEAQQARMRQIVPPLTDGRPRYILGPMNNVVGLDYTLQETDEFPAITQADLDATSSE